MMELLYQVKSMHALGVVHGDIRPNRVLICSSRRLFITGARHLLPEEDPKTWQHFVPGIAQLFASTAGQRPQTPSKFSDIQALYYFYINLFRWASPQPRDIFRERSEDPTNGILNLEIIMGSMVGFAMLIQ